MHGSKSIMCYNCNSIILDLPEEEVLKLNGLNFVCENCGHHNLLKDFRFFKGLNQDPYHNPLCWETIAI